MSNGPDYNAPEEMDFIEPGKHYGFPFQFSTWPVQPHFPYPLYAPRAAGDSFSYAARLECRAGRRWERGQAARDIRCALLARGDDLVR